MSVVRTQMAVLKSAQTLMEATGVLVAMVIACRIMVYNVMVSEYVLCEHLL